MNEVQILTPESLTYGQFVSLDEKLRSFYMYNLEFMKDSDIIYPVTDYFGDLEISSLSFGEVKEFIASLDNTEEMWKLVTRHYDEQKMVDEKAYKTIYTFRSIAEQIESIIKYEQEILVSRVPNKYSVELENADFTAFDSWFIQRDELAGGDVTKYEQIDSLPYRTCFMKLLYNIKQGDVEKMILAKK